MTKCVIIGSGLGGLSCGCILARNGYDVTILEQGAQIGGCLQCFSREGVQFETGMHYIGSIDKGQTLYAIARYLGIDKDLRLSRLDTGGYDIISLRGERYPLANGRMPFISSLEEYFPDSGKDIERYYDLIKHVTSAMRIHSLSRKPDLLVNSEYQAKSVGSVIDETVRDPLLREVLGGISPLYAGKRYSTPFTTHALIADGYEKSAFRIEGGSGKIAASFKRSIESMGGRVLTRKKVTKIECDAAKAVGVICADGDRFKADVIISDIHPASTLRLTDNHLLSPVYRRRIECLSNTTGAFSVYLKLKKDSVPYMNSNLYLYRGDSVWGSERYDESTWPKFLLYLHFCHEQNPRFAESAEIITYMNYDDVKKWADTRTGHRGEDYEDFKRRKAELVVGALEKECPEMRGNIESIYTSTPLTYRDYVGAPQGSMYGIAKNVSLGAAGGVSPRTRISNLLLTGQSITSHGMLGVLEGSIVTCSTLLTLDTIYDQIERG